MSVADWKSQGEVVFNDSPGYHAALEEFRRGHDCMVFLHLTVWKKRASVYKEILRNWVIFRKHVTCPLYAVGGDVDQDKWEAFVSKLGFKFLTNVVCENGVSRRLFVHFIQEEKDANERYINNHKQQPDPRV